MTLVDVLNVPSLSDPEISPNGRQLVYVLAAADWSTNRRVSRLWRVNIDGAEATVLTSGMFGAADPRWSPDGTQIAFVGRRNESQENQVYVLSTTGGEARQLTTHATAPSRIAWSPDGAFVYFIAADPRTADEREGVNAKDDIYAYSENFKQEHLWRISVVDKVEHRVTDGDYSVQGYRLSRDGQKIVFHRAPGPFQEQSPAGEVWVSAASGTGPIQLTHNAVGEDGAEISPDNSQVLFLAYANDKFEDYYDHKLFVVPTAGGTPRRLMLDFDRQVVQATWSNDGKTIFFVGNLGVHTELFQLDLATGKARQLTDGKHTLRFWTYFPMLDRHIFAIDEPRNAGDVYSLPGTSGGAPARITHVFDYLANEFALPRQEAIQWKGADGTSVEGLLLYPLDYVAGKRYPLVVQTQGFKFSSDTYTFGRWIDYNPVFTAKGYAVLKTNYRGVAAYGDAFLRDMIGGYFHNAHLDVMTGVDRVIEMGVADPDRLVAMGWSAGGTMTDKLITYTDRLKAASSGAGVVNMISVHAQSDVHYYRTPIFRGTPWQKDAPIDVYWNNSPLKDIWKVKTPTIIFAGERDVRVPAPQSIELYQALKSNGVPTRLYMAPREPHGWQELRHQLFKMNAELGWFEKYAMGRTYTWEKPQAASAGQTATPKF